MLNSGCTCTFLAVISVMHINLYRPCLFVAVSVLVPHIHKIDYDKLVFILQENDTIVYYKSKTRR